jgi:hypothetical protein
MFDYETVAQEAGFTAAQLARLCANVRKEFPRDEMMFELHVLRACMAVRDGRITIDQALAEPEPEPVRRWGQPGTPQK